DGLRVVNSTPYGFDDAGEFRLYLPGRATADLPRNFLEWIAMPNVWNMDKLPATLPFYALYNINGEEGFFSVAA
ncbi:MAG: hypothetical protein FWD72_02505, partial [Eggerthellaceae bacterium]|nr:hypothetical protein [Eggerthellaceae bacterium]